MKRVFTATCLAATFAVGLAAQSTATSGTAGTATGQDPQAAGGQRGGGARTVTGCLRAGDTAGTYMLTDVAVQGGAAPRGGDATSTGSTAAGSSTGTATSPEGGRATAPASIMLNAASDVDLKTHVGHKIEVTGTLAGGRASETAGSATGTASGTTGTTASGSEAGIGTSASGRGTARPGPRSMTVTSIRMVSESCS
jgi:hypothetical protein